MVSQGTEKAASIVGDVDVASIKLKPDDSFDWGYLRVRISINASDKTTIQATFQGVDRIMWDPSRLSRRAFLTLLGGGFTTAALLTACGKRSPQISDLRTASKWFSDQTIVSNLGPQRTIWSFSDENGNLGGLSPQSIEVEIADAALQVVHTTKASLHKDGVAMPYYPVIVPFRKSEVHEFRFDLGTRGRYVGYAVPGSKSASSIIWPGDRFPALATPTSSNSRGVNPICTREPSCPFHERSLEDSIASQNATVLIVSTPAFCGTKWMCGPVLENLISHVGGEQQGLDVIHVEVYSNPTGDELGPIAPAVEAMGVGYEPFIFLIDEGGMVLRRLDHIWDNAELRELLSLV
ncbi:MAG: hypothetical protein CL460_08545 [Acidimicrobiaceae bacterium]|jgi:hypothetical protein|nr:hypothetical protein [Acidimicrobiaceae bacterium]MED5361178.1 hypothetical protein [Actinomycetota bacterium]